MSLPIHRYQRSDLLDSIHLQFRQPRSIKVDKIETHRGQDGDEITLSPLVVERTVDRDLSLVRQVDAEVAVTVSGGDPVTSDTLVAANPAAVAGRDRVFDDSVHTGIRVDRIHILEDRRADRSELRGKRTGKLFST